MPARIPWWTLLLTLVLASFTASSAAPPPAPGPSVTVINSADNPVPVTGSVTATLAGTPVPVTGAVTATLAGTPTVQVANTAATPIFVEPGVANARETFFLRVDKSNTGLSVDYTVPADKILVIESINVSGFIAETLDRDIVDLRIRPPGVDVINATTIQYVPVLLTPYGRPTTFGAVDVRRAVASLTTRLYAGPSHDLLFGAPTLEFGSASTSAVIVASGYFVPAGTPRLAP